MMGLERRELNKGDVRDRRFLQKPANCLFSVGTEFSPRYPAPHRPRPLLWSAGPSQTTLHYRAPMDLRRWFSKRSPQTRSLTITWKRARVPSKTDRVGHSDPGHLCLTSPPGDCDAGRCLEHSFLG